MTFAMMPPRDQLVTIMKRIYDNGMTTLSGGNLSIKDPNGDIWITPAGVDKGALTPDDIICTRADGTTVGPHRPSSELPFHRAIYTRRPDINAVVHAHPPALVSFSIVREVPDTRIIPQVNRVCGQVGYAPYALTGSEQLGVSIAETFAKGHDAIILENHGAATVGNDLLDAFQRLETLEFCARMLIAARKLGRVRMLGDAELDLFHRRQVHLDEFVPDYHSSHERELRQQMTRIVQRAVQRHLMMSTAGVVSARLDAESFLITPTGVDRGTVTNDDIVLIREGQREQGKHPSRAVLLHQSIYEHHPEIHSIITAQCPAVTAYAIADVDFNSHTIPESYILLRNVPKMPFDRFYNDLEAVARGVALHTPVTIVENDCVLVVGTDVLNAFDRLEVAEYSARSLIDASSLGPVVSIADEEIRELDVVFNLSTASQ